MSELTRYLTEQAGQFEADLCALLAIPSVSTDPQRLPAMERCAREVARQLEEAGMTDVRVMPTAGHPVVFGASPHREGLPTVLVYGHYDVQPEDPVELWESPPFEPTVRDGKIYARGATDDKGQFLIHVKAAQAWVATCGSLPVNLKFVIEGEEEIGSPSLAPWLEAHRDLLAADVMVVSDTTLYAPGIPALIYGLRGLAYLQVDVKAADSDLHSGMFGGAVPNPAMELSRILARLKDESERITAPGFYDEVRPLAPEERAEFAALPFDEEAYRRSVGSPGLSGEAGYTTLERKWARPTLEINGLLSGFTGSGAKTVLPHRAMAKISCRLVPDQDPDRIADLLEAEIRRLAPPTVEIEVTRMHGGPPWLTPPDHPVMGAARRAAERAFGRPPVLIREGGSIPIIPEFSRILGCPAVLLGIGLSDENLHAPNEHLNLGNFHRGVEAAAWLMEELARVLTPASA